MDIPLSLIFDELDTSSLVEQLRCWANAVEMSGQVVFTWDADSEPPSFESLLDAATVYEVEPRLLRISQTFAVSVRDHAIHGSLHAWRTTKGSSLSVTPWDEPLCSKLFGDILRIVGAVRPSSFVHPLAGRFALEQSEPTEYGGGQLFTFVASSFEDVLKSHSEWLAACQAVG